MRTLTVRRAGAEATLRIERGTARRIERSWSGDRQLARDCEAAIERYRREMPDGPTLDLPPVRIDITMADLDPLAHRMLCVVAIERYVEGAEIVDRYVRGLEEWPEPVYY
jgi:hypothetical protein